MKNKIQGPRKSTQLSRIMNRETVQLNTLSLKVINSFLFIGISIFTSLSLASIPHALRSPRLADYSYSNFTFLRTTDFSRGVDFGVIQPVASDRETTAKDISKIIPSNMKPSSDGGLVASQILDHSLSNWFNSEAVKNSSVGRTAHQIEKSMTGDVSFGGTRKNSIKHNLKFAMKATQTQALLEYSGLTNAQLTYFIVQEKTDVELRENVRALKTQVVFNQTSSRSNSQKMLSLRWNW